MHGVLPQQLGVHTLTRTSGVDSDVEAPWPRLACQSDIVNCTDIFDLCLEIKFLSSPNDIKGVPNSFNIGFGRPSLEPDVVIDLLLVLGDVGPGSERFASKGCDAIATGVSEHVCDVRD